MNGDKFRLLIMLNVFFIGQTCMTSLGFQKLGENCCFSASSMNRNNPYCNHCQHPFYPKPDVNRNIPNQILPIDYYDVEESTTEISPADLINQVNSGTFTESSIDNELAITDKRTTVSFPIIDSEKMTTTMGSSFIDPNLFKHIIEESQSTKSADKIISKENITIDSDTEGPIDSMIFTVESSTAAADSVENNIMESVSRKSNSDKMITTGNSDFDIDRGGENDFESVDYYSDTDYADNIACKFLKCDFENESLCLYETSVVDIRQKQLLGFRWKYLRKKKDIIQFGGNDRRWIVRSGNFGNRITGILRAGANGSYYSASYLRPGQRSFLWTDILFFTTKRIIFQSYEATEGLTLAACCDSLENCPWKSNNDLRKWIPGWVECPEATKKLFFVCENSSKNQGVCGLDSIQVEDVLCENPK